MGLFKDLLNKDVVNIDYDSIKKNLFDEFDKIIDNDITEYNYDILRYHLENNKSNLYQEFLKLEDKTKDEDDIYRKKHQLQIMGFIMNKLSKKNLLENFIKDIYRKE